ncbi:serine threonine protein kinase CMGC group [Coemansia sp. Benny D115]|nr:serine threonine protein kinase CMGC group [Coemansia sp. Benny D115]
MSVLSFVASLFRPRIDTNNNTADSANHNHATDDSKPPRFRSSPGSHPPTQHRHNNNHHNHKNVNGNVVHRTFSFKQNNDKPPPKNVSYNNVSNAAASASKQPNQLRRIFSSSKINPRPVAIKTRNNTLTSANGFPLRHAQQKAEPSCDDRDGHYIVVPGRDFTPRFKIRRLLGQGTFGKVMECEDAATGRLVAIKVIRAVPKYRDAAKTEIRVLQTLKRNDPSNVYQCMHVNETFDHRNHVCMIFDLLGPSVFDFLKENEFRPFSLHHVQLFAEQLLRSVAFLHSLNLIHTDLKPENILLENGEYDVVPFGNNQTVKTRMLKSTNICLIDFGSATFNNEYHAQVVSTRHYRAPEIILNLGWSFPCDMWSIGCIILELLTGEALFQTHDNNEHLAMMEVVVGKAPLHIVRSVSHDLRVKFFRSDMSVRYPAPEQPRQSQKGLRAMRSLSQLVNPSTNPIYANLHDLLFRLLQYDPRARISAKEACEHPFFRYRVGPDGRLVNRPPAPVHHHSQQHPLAVSAGDVASLSTSTTAVASSQQQQQHKLVAAHYAQQPQQPQPQTLQQPLPLRAVYPSGSSNVMPQLPATAVVAGSSVYPYSSNGTSSAARAPLHPAASHYPVSGVATSGGASASASHHHLHSQISAAKPVVTNQPAVAQQQLQQQHGYYYREQQQQPPNAAPIVSSAGVPANAAHSAYHSDYSNRPTPHFYPSQAQPQQQAQHHQLPQQHYHHQQQQQAATVGRSHGDAFPWQYAGSANISAVTTPTTGTHGANGVGAALHHHNPHMVPATSGNSGSHHHHHQQQQQQQPAVVGAEVHVRGSGKRKDGAPIDSGYFPDMPPSSVSECFPGSNGNSSPALGVPPTALSSGSSALNGLPQPLARNYSTGHFSGALMSPGYAATHGGNKGCNLPSLSSHMFQSASSGAAIPPIVTPGGNSTQQQHAYHQQRHFPQMTTTAGPLSSSGQISASANGSLVPRHPMDANMTPRLTTATTATPTPGSSSAQLSGSHSLENSLPTSSIVNMGSSSAITGAHKLAGRSLPSLALAQGPNNAHIGSISNGLARANIVDAQQQQQQQQMRGNGRAQQDQQHHQQPLSARSSHHPYPHLPSAQTLLQSPMQQLHHHQSGVSSPIEFSGAPSHYRAHFAAQPSSANNSGY